MDARIRDLSALTLLGAYFFHDKSDPNLTREAEYYVVLAETTRLVREIYQGRQEG
jgi:hypothetical protein